jgi:23S rRNA (cytosine1962-C5)-methyltransferase
LHSGSPAAINQAWWKTRAEAAATRRSDLFDQRTTGYRCIHGENDGWPGLVLDRYGSTFVLKLYTAAWFRRLEEIVPPLANNFGIENLVLRLSRNIQAKAEGFGRKDGRILRGSTPDSPVIFLESGLRFEADVIRGQKTGFFLDQRENRRKVETLAKGRTVLNAFSFSGGFSLYAARGGARSVLNLDISNHALESARRNFLLNKSVPAVAACHVEYAQADVFAWLKDSPERKFALVILDPPALAKNKSERAQALNAYGNLIGNGIRRLKKTGVLVAASCSAPVRAEEFFDLARLVAHRSGRKFQELATTGHPPDHAATFPEGEYLKCIYLQF